MRFHNAELHFNDDWLLRNSPQMMTPIILISKGGINISNRSSTSLLHQNNLSPTSITLLVTLFETKFATPLVRPWQVCPCLCLLLVGHARRTLWVSLKTIEYFYRICLDQKNKMQFQCYNFIVQGSFFYIFKLWWTLY